MLGTAALAALAAAPALADVKAGVEAWSRGDYAAAVSFYETLAAHKSVAPEDILSRLGRASLAAGNRSRAAEAFLRVYYEFTFSPSVLSVRVRSFMNSLCGRLGL